MKENERPNVISGSRKWFQLTQHSDCFHGYTKKDNADHFFAGYLLLSFIIRLFLFNCGNIVWIGELDLLSYFEQPTRYSSSNYR